MDLSSSSPSSTGALWEEIFSTFLASVRSVGTACTLAGIGIYLHQRGYVVGEGKRTLALISQQVTIPLLFFTKIIYCNQDWSEDPCPNVTESLKDVWVLLVWPLYVCGSGLLVGYICAKFIAKVPPSQINGMLVAVGFGNCTGLPITLLTVIHSNFPAGTDMGRIDPTLFLSVYLILYPILQWGVGGWLLAPPEKKTTGDNYTHKKKHDTHDSDANANADDDDDDDDDDDGYVSNKASAAVVEGGGVGSSDRSSTTHSGHNFLVESLRNSARHADHALAHNVLNRSEKMSVKYQIAHRGLESVDASFYMSVPENLNRWGRPVYGSIGTGTHSPNHDVYTDPRGGGDGDVKGTKFSGDDDDINRQACDSTVDAESHTSIGMDLSNNIDDNARMTSETIVGYGSSLNLIPEEETALKSPQNVADDMHGTFINDSEHTEVSVLLKPSCGKLPRQQLSMQQNGTDPDEVSSSGSTEVEEQLCQTCFTVVRRCLQPPVIGALLGLLVASTPSLRGIFVDIVDRTGDAPLEWLFDGLYTTGQAAVPLNMMILGCNLSASAMLNSNDAVHKEKFFSPRATASVVIGKMVVMPIIGYISAYGLKLFYHVPEEISGSFYLVLLIVFLCPTANNVMVMVELSGSGSKEGMARIIAYQYMIAPLILSLTVTVAVFMASSM